MNHVAVSNTRSQLGTTWSYIERMPGRSDMLAVARAGDETVNIVSAALVAVARAEPELKDDPQKRAKVEQFLRGEFRDVCRNTLLLAWLELSRNQPDDDFENRLKLRVTQYLAERGYLPTTLPISALDLPGGELIARGVLHRIAVVLDNDSAAPLPEWLAQYSDEQKLSAAFEAGLAAIGKTQAELEATMKPAIPEIFDSGLSGEVRWRASVEPVETNGEWQPDEHVVVWGTHAVAGPLTPEILYAVWAEPDEAFQKEHFGSVLIRAQLPAYNAWAAQLDKKQATQWEQFLTMLKPDDTLKDKLAAFQFEGKSAPDGSDEEHAPVPGAEILISAIKSTEAPAE